MNDFSELETELKRLRPAPVSDALFARIERALLQPDAMPTAGVLPRPASRSKVWWSLGLGLTAASALILVGLTFFAEPPATMPALAQQTVEPAPVHTNAATPARSGFQPSALTQVVYRHRDEGLVFSPNQSERLLRRVRYDTRETMQWRNPQTGASLRVSYPAEQVVLTPVSFQ
ncbi:MAG: anti-sigma factor [Chthoniobacterales bacterium]|nr:anti-sigma factor [Chthoniobacterales bacterium]